MQGYFLSSLLTYTKVDHRYDSEWPDYIYQPFEREQLHAPTP